MSEDITALIVRNGVNVTPKPVVIQMDKLSPQEAQFYQGADPHFTYNAYTTMLPMNDPFFVRQDDHVIDQVYVDPLLQQLGITPANRYWRIISDPERFPQDSHWEFVAVLYRGT